MTNTMANVNTQNLLIQSLYSIESVQDWVAARAPRWIKWIWSLIKALLQGLIQQVLREILLVTLRWCFGQSEQRKESTLQSKLLIQWTSVVGELTFMWKS